MLEIGRVDMMSLSDQPRVGGLERILFRADHYAYDPQALGFFVVMLFISLCGFIILHRVRPGRTRELVFLHVGILSIWLFARGCARLAVDPEYILFWYRVAYAVIPLGLAMIFNYIMHAAGLELVRKTWIRVVWICAAMFAILPSVWEHYNVVGIAEFSWGYEPVHGWMGTLMMVLVLVMALRGMSDLIGRCRETDPRSDEGKRLRGVTLATSALLFTYADFLVAEGVPVYPIGFITVLLFFIGIAWVSMRWGLIDITAEVAADRVVNVVSTAMLVVDRAGHVRVANNAACEVLATSRSDLLSESLDSLFQKMPSMKRFEKVGSSESLEQISLTRMYHGQEREFSLSLSAQRNAKGEPQAFICLLRDMGVERRLERERLGASLRDPLTGLPGRKTFLEFVDISLRDAQRGHTPCGVLFIAVNRFKSINEEISFKAGDEVLCQIARRISENMGTRDFVARVGGDEFAVLLESGYRDEVVTSDADKILELFRQPILVEGHKVHVSLSIGVALPSAENPGDAVGLLRNAARAMQVAKDKGHSGFHLFNHDEHSASGEIELEAQIREGLARDEFIPFYQPVYDLERGQIVGFEALARWQHSERGLVGAYEFIEFAENTGLIGDISRSIQEKVFSDLAELKAELGANSPYVSINISDFEFRKHNFIDNLTAQMGKYSIQPSDICLEITERMVMLDPGDDRLETLSERGFRLFIDDFGTGYSSMTRLHTLPLDTLKIDRQFILAMGRSENGGKLVEGIIKLARSLDLTVIAEGVAEPHEADSLRGYRCPYVQGFHFGKPMPFADARSELLAKHPQQALH